MIEINAYKQLIIFYVEKQKAHRIWNGKQPKYYVLLNDCGVSW